MSSQHTYRLPDAWPARAADAILLVAAAVTPMLLNPWGCSPFERPKAALVQALALLALPLLALRALDAWTRGSGRARLRSVPLLAWAALAWGLAQTAATAFSVDPRASLWGAADRQQGLVTLLSYLALFFLAAGMDVKGRVEQLLQAIAWGSAPVVAYGLLQALGIDPLGWRTDAASLVLSTLGRSNFVGTYLVLVLPATAARAWLARRRGPYLALLAAQTLCLLLTRARSAWLGAAACLLAVVALWAMLSARRRWLGWGLAGVVGGVILLLAEAGVRCARCGAPTPDRPPRSGPSGGGRIRRHRHPGHVHGDQGRRVLRGHPAGRPARLLADPRPRDEGGGPQAGHGDRQGARRAGQGHGRHRRADHAAVGRGR